MARPVEHGHSGPPPSPEYSAWRSMKNRCLNPNAHNFKLYGARGIRICDAWRDDFAAFLAHIGPRPSPTHSLDRINNDGNYEPGNIRWATGSQQSSNRRTNHWLVVRGQRKTIMEWGRIVGLDASTIHSRLKVGKSPEQAVFTPSRRPRLRNIRAAARD